MRQSLSKSSTDEQVQTRRDRRWIAVTIWAATATSALTLAVAALDQGGSQRLYGHTEAAYAGHGVSVDPTLVYSIIYAIAVMVTLLWALMIPLSRLRGLRAPSLSAGATIITCVTALLLLTAAEYGERVFSPVWGGLMLLPGALGIIVTILLVRHARG